MHSFESNGNIPAFILKLWKLVQNDSSNDLICWNRNGRSFTIKDQGRFSKEMLPLYFKHNNMASFIRQLNMYGFRKVSNIDHSGLKTEADEVEFFHPYFTQGKEDQLQFIKRKMSNNKSLTSITKVDDIQDILADVESIKGRQDSVDTLLNNLKRENEALWREIAILRQKHIKQQQIVEKLLHFLVSIVRKNCLVSNIKRKAPLLIDSTIPNNRKILKTSKDDNTICISPSPSASGLIIHDITELEDSSHPVIQSPTNTLITDLQLNLDASSSDNNKILQTNQSTSLIPTNIDISNTKNTTDYKEISIPEILEIDLNQAHNSNVQQQNLNNNSVLNTPNFDDPISTGPSDSSINIFSTDLVLPTKQKTLNTPTGPNLTKLTSENFNDHVEGIDTELNWLQDQLYGGTLNIDPSTLLGLFSSEYQLPIPDGLESTSTETTIPKAITGGNKMIKTEDNSSDSNLFEGLDLNIENNSKDDNLSDFTSGIDISQFN